jgi:hypothetical protein
VSSRSDFPQRSFIIYAADNDQWQFWTGTGEQTGWHSIAGPNVVVGEWIHLVGTYNGVTKSFYVNGTLIGQADVANGVNPTNVLRIGAGRNELVAGDYFFNGAVDEVAVYDYALPAGRILAHYALGIGSTTVSIERSGTDLIIHWSTGVLEGADEVTGPFSEVSSTPPTYTVPAGAATKFFRVRVSNETTIIAAGSTPDRLRMSGGLAQPFRKQKTVSPISALAHR